MTNLFSKRLWRSIAIKVLPEAIKGPLRKKLHGFRSNNCPMQVHFWQDELGLQMQLQNEIKLRITEEFQHSVRYQCIDNVDAIEETKAFLAISRDKHVLFDVGAYTGLFTLLFCALADDKRAIAFEPSPSMAPIIQSLLRNNGFDQRVTVENIAIGDSEGSISFALEETGFVQILPEGPQSRQINVPLTTIDNACERLAIRPDLLKIDVEGFELEALRGAEKLLSNERPILFMELHLNYLETRGIKPSSVTDYLQQKNYQFYSCHGDQLSARDIYDSAKPVIRFVARPHATQVNAK